MGYTIPIDICIICNKIMSEYSQHLSSSNGWACTLCSSCEADIIDAYGPNVLSSLMGVNGLMSQIRARLETMKDPDEIKEAIYDLVVRFIEEIGSDNGEQILDGIFDTLS